MRIAAFVLACVAVAHADKPAFHAADWKIAVELQAVLRPVEMKAEEWVRRFKPSDDVERQPIGFRGTRVLVERYGEETTFRATMIERGGKVVALRIETWEFSKAKLERLRTAWGESVHAIRGGMAYAWVEPKRRAALHADIERELGLVTPAKVPEALRAAWTLLRDPTQTCEFGLSCYESGEAPAGCVAIEALVAAKRTDLVRAVLRSANPEARLHAALALICAAKQTGKALTPADAKAIAILRAQRITIRCCDGCLVSDKKPGQALDELLPDTPDEIAPKPAR